MLITQLCPTLFDPMDCISPGSSVHGVLQARILDWVAIPFSRGSSLPRDQTQVSWIAGGFFTIWAIIWKPKGFQREARWKHWLSSLVGSTVHGIFQARMMEWVAISSSRETSWPRNQTYISYVSCIGRQANSLPLCHMGSPILDYIISQIKSLPIFGKDVPFYFLDRFFFLSSPGLKWGMKEKDK